MSKAQKEPTSSLIGNAGEALTGRPWGFSMLDTALGAHKSHVPSWAMLLRMVLCSQWLFHHFLPQNIHVWGQQWQNCFSLHLAPLCPPAEESALVATAAANPICGRWDHFLSQPRHLALWLVQLIALLAGLNSHGEAWGGAHLSYRALFILCFERMWLTDINFLGYRGKSATG